MPLRRIKVRMKRVFRTGERAEKMSLSLAVGVFVGISPLIGLHTVIILAVAFIFRLNKIAALAGTFINNPWTFMPISSVSIAFGYLLMGEKPRFVEPGSEAAPDIVSLWAAFYANMEELLIPFVLGSTVLGVVSSVATYFAANLLIKRFRKKRKKYLDT